MNIIECNSIAENIVKAVIKAAADSGKDAASVPVTIDNYRVVVNEDWRNPVTEKLQDYELAEIGRYILSICLSKGYGCTMYHYQLGVRCWDSTCKFPDSITIFNKEVCPEFIELQNICKEKLNFVLKKTDLYKVSTSGKRGRYFEEVDTRKFTCYNPKECQYLIDRIKTCLEKGIKMHIGKHEDQEDKQASIYYETECYGSIEYDICPVTMG